MKTILITGGLGFIGSHIVSVIENGERVVIIDNLSNSDVGVYENLVFLNPKSEIIFKKGDVLDELFLDDLFREYKFDTVIHLASLKSVKESIDQPLFYYRHNLNGLMNILDKMKTYHCYELVFSSSATVYGSKNKSPLSETDTVGQHITNPYGQTKYFQEQILNDFSNANKHMKIVILRYFNPIGSHPSGLIDEKTKTKPSNIFPYILGVVQGKYPYLTIFGNDYETKDGTCLRDYIHVMDLAKAHIYALRGMKQGVSVYNVGTGEPKSVLDLVKMVEEKEGVSVLYKIAERRDGDVSVSYTNPEKIKRDLNWSASSL